MLLIIIIYIVCCVGEREETPPTPVIPVVSAVPTGEGSRESASASGQCAPCEGAPIIITSNGVNLFQ